MSLAYIERIVTRNMPTINTSVTCHIPIIIREQVTVEDNIDIVLLDETLAF